MKTIIVLSLIGALLTSMIGVLLKDPKFFRVKEITYNIIVPPDERLVWNDEISKVESTLKIFYNRSIWNVSMDEVKNKLAPFTHLENTQVQRVWPSTIEVKYSLPSLKAIYSINDKKFKILTEEGRWLGPLYWSRLPNLPWLRGNWVDRKPELQLKALELLRQLPERGTLTPAQISEIQYNDIDGFLVTLLKTGQQIRFGIENFELKSLRAVQVLEYLQSKGLESRVIDLNFSKKVLVRLRNQP